MSWQAHAKLKSDVRLALADDPDLVLFNNAGGFDEEKKIRYGLGKGSPDVVGILQGYFIGMEMKTGKGVCTPEQKAWLMLIRKFGGFADEIRSVEQAKSFLAFCRETIRSRARWDREAV